MRLFRRKSERPPPAACLMSLSPLRNDTNSEDSGGQSQETNGAQRPTHLHIKGANNSSGGSTTPSAPNNVKIGEKSPKTPVKKGLYHLFAPFLSSLMSCACEKSRLS